MSANMIARIGSSIFPAKCTRAETPNCCAKALKFKSMRLTEGALTILSDNEEMRLASSGHPICLRRV